MLPSRAITSTALCFAIFSSSGNLGTVSGAGVSADFIKPSPARWDSSVSTCWLVNGVSSVFVSSNTIPLNRSSCNMPNLMPVSSSISFCSLSANSAKLSFAITCKRLIFLSSMRSPSWLTQRRRPRPTFWRAVRVFFCSMSVQTWNTFGLSQPSFSAEWEKIKRRGQSKDKSHSLSFIIVL